jgi:hypothetical protein
VISSAEIKVICANNKVSTISTSSLFFIYQITLEKNTHVNTQNNIHQNNIEANFSIHKRYVSPLTIHHSKITQRITRNIANAVPSLNKLSHSKISANFLGAQIDLNIDNTATGSVADIRDQNNKHIMKGIFNQMSGNTTKSPHAIITAEIINQNIASILIDFQLLIICL